MADYLTHYYLHDIGPFHTLSALPDVAALEIMKALRDDTPFGARFKHPARYLQNRKETVRWVRE